MKYLYKLLFVAAMCLSVTSAWGDTRLRIVESGMVGNNIAMFVPEGYDAQHTPSFTLVKEPKLKSRLSKAWSLIPSFTSEAGHANAVLNVPQGTSLYGGGEVTGPLLRNGMSITLWNTDSGAYSVDGGRRLYQSHPWMMGVRPDGTAFGILFDTTWKSVLSSTNEQISIQTEGLPFRVFVIDRNSPQEVVEGLAELTGTMPMIPRWALGYHQCRFSYTPDTRVMEVANTFRTKQIPCDVIWMDIDYMDGYRIFTFNPKSFSDPLRLNNYLHEKGFHSAWMIDPGAKVDKDYFVYRSGVANDVWVKTASGKEFHGDAWPGQVAFPDFTAPHVRDWWAGLYKDFLAKGVDGVWNDVNEPQINDTPNKTMPEDNWHKGGDGIPAGTHAQYHNVYGYLMVKASRQGMLQARPEKRPFILTRSNFLGGQRYASTWTGDNGSTWEHLKLSIPMSLTLGLSGQPFSGADIGGFLFNAEGNLFANWIGVGAFYPFSRGHACAGTNDKEPWAFGPEVERSARISLERRYRLLPYLYTLLHEASVTGLPMMRPAFFADIRNQALRGEQQIFLLGSDLLVIPAFAKQYVMPRGVWRNISLVSGDRDDAYQSTLKLRAGAILPVGKIVQNTNQESLDPLTLYISLDNKGKAVGRFYWDEGDGWSYQQGNYYLATFKAERRGGNVVVKLSDSKGKYRPNISNVVVKVITDQGVFDASGDIRKGIRVSNVQ